MTTVLGVLNIVTACCLATAAVLVTQMVEDQKDNKPIKYVGMLAVFLLIMGVIFNVWAAILRLG